MLAQANRCSPHASCVAASGCSQDPPSPAPKGGWRTVPVPGPDTYQLGRRDKRMVLADVPCGCRPANRPTNSPRRATLGAMVVPTVAATAQAPELPPTTRTRLAPKPHREVTRTTGDRHTEMRRPNRDVTVFRKKLPDVLTAKPRPKRLRSPVATTTQALRPLPATSHRFSPGPHHEVNSHDRRPTHRGVSTKVETSLSIRESPQGV